jgi:hypothetical protein
MEATMTDGVVPTRRLLTSIGVLGAVSIAVVLVSAAVMLFQGPPSSGPIGAGSNAFNWSSDTVQISAAAVGIEMNGRLFSADPIGTSVLSEPGSPTNWTVELKWLDHDREFGMYLGFGADNRTWWLADVRVREGVAGGSSKWVALPPGTYLNTPINRAWTGNLDLVGPGQAGPVAVHIDGATIRVVPPKTFAAPPNGGKALPEGSRPFASGGELHCSGILQMTPRNAQASLFAMGYRVSWRLRLAPTAGQTPLNQPPGLGAAADVWELRIEPPTGVIVDFGLPVTSDGAVVLSVLPQADPDAHKPPVPDDCPTVGSGTEGPQVALPSP